MPYMIKVTGLSGEKTHYINLNLVDRIDLFKLPNTVAYRLYVHSHHSDLDIVISYKEAENLQKALEGML